MREEDHANVGVTTVGGNFVKLEFFSDEAEADAAVRDIRSLLRWLRHEPLEK